MVMWCAAHDPPPPHQVSALNLPQPAPANMDTTAVLDKYTQDLLNLPLEIKHLFEELKAKDAQLTEARRRYQGKDAQLHKFVRANSTLAKHPKEPQMAARIEEDMRLVQRLQREKILLANTALFVVLKHLYNFEVDIHKLEQEDLLPPVDENAPATVLVLRSPLPDPVRRKRPYLVMKHRKRPRADDMDDSDYGELPARFAQNVAKAVPAEDADNNLYCFCKRVSFGEMIGCDNDDCKYEWFHWSCVGITSPPKDDEVWYCPDCAPKMEKKKKRKK